MTIDLTENELKVVMNAVWLQLHGSASVQGAYRHWLLGAYDKIHAALPPPREFAENH